MNQSVLVSQTFALADVNAPGASTLGVFSQKNASSGSINITLPTADADGTPLTGLVNLTVLCIATPDATTNPFAGLTPDQAVAIGGVDRSDNALTPADAGTSKDVGVKFASGSNFIAIAAFTTDA